MHVCPVLLVLWVSANDYDYVLDALPLALFSPCKYGMHVCLFSVITVSSIILVDFSFSPNHQVGSGLH